MKVVELVAPGRLQLAERPAPELGSGEVRIAVSHVGICGTDMEFYAGRRSAGSPFILGHECAGRIDAVGPGCGDWETGTAVTVRPNFGCGRCALCGAGRDNICSNSRGLGVTVDGCLAEFIVAPERYVWRVPDGMSLETATLIEPTAVAERAVRRAGMLGGRRVLILGAGTIGLLALQSASLAGAEVTVADPIPKRREWAKTLGASHVEEAGDGAPDDAAFDVVIETAGVSRTVPPAIERARPGGRVVLTGIPMDEASVGTRWIVWHELEVVGSFIYDLTDFARASDRLAFGEIDALSLVTGRFPVERAGEAFESVARREGMKVLLRMTEEEN